MRSNDEYCENEILSTSTYRLEEYCQIYKNQFYHMACAMYTVEMEPCPYMDFYTCNNRRTQECIDDLLIMRDFRNNKCRGKPVRILDALLLTFFLNHVK